MIEDETDQNFRAVANGFSVGCFGRHVQDDHLLIADHQRGREHHDGCVDRRPAKPSQNQNQVLWEGQRI